MKTGLTLVAGATGTQGGAVARQLMAGGHRVRVLTRAPHGTAAKVLAASGAGLAMGDFDDATSLREAMMGVSAVFSMQNATANEVEHGQRLVAEAVRAGVSQFIHSSVTGTATRTEFPDWGSGRWSESYWNAKWEVEEMVRKAGFAFHTVLRPAFMMENFLPPKVDFMFPDLRTGFLATALHADTPLQLISAEDIGRFSLAAVEDPAGFSGLSIDLAADSPSLIEIAATLSQQLSRSIPFVPLTPEQALAKGQSPGWVRSQQWINAHGYRASIKDLERFGIRPIRLDEWLRTRRDQFAFD